MDYKIVIISDGTKDAESIKDLISDDFTQCIVAFDYQFVLDAINDLEPCVLVFYLESISVAENYYLRLYRSTDGLKRFPHKTVILCGIEESKEAYSLCREYVFDDYLSVNPVHDVYRLKLCLYQAIKLLAMEEKIKQSSDLSITWLNNITEYEKIASNNVEETDRLYDDVAAGHGVLSGEIVNDISALAAGFEGDGYKKNITINSSKGFCSQFNKDTRAVVESAIDRSLNRFSNRIDTIKEQHVLDHSHIQKNRKNLSKKANNSISQLIMVADGDASFVNYTCNVLKENNYRVLAAKNSKEVLSKAMRELPLLILLESNLQGMGRDDTIRMINVLYKDNPPAVIVITESTTRKTLVDIINAGASAVIAKPFKTDALLEKVESILFLKSKKH